MNLADEEFESVLWVARECYVYRLPPRTSSAGYRATEWGDMENFLWKGRLRIIEISRTSDQGGNNSTKCFIRLEDSTSGELFANCPYSLDGKSVEPVLDSSRYYVIKVEDATTDQRAFLGMGFLERTDSFDFNVTLQDWTKRQRIMSQQEASENELSPHVQTGPKRDFSLKEGQTISISFGGGNRNKSSISNNKPSEKKPTSNGSQSLIPPLLPPPPPPRK